MMLHHNGLLGTSFLPLFHAGETHILGSLSAGVICSGGLSFPRDVTLRIIHSFVRNIPRSSAGLDFAASVIVQN